jgi:antitoxin component YwqK of YwqJK toxin-antitoxin module
MKALNLIFVIIFFIFIAGCSTTVEEKYPNGNIKMKGRMKDGKMQGEWVFYYENGVKQAEGTFIDGNGTDVGNSGVPRSGRTGVWKFYDEQGKLSSEQIFQNNEVNLIRYNVNDKKITDYFYDEDKMNWLPKRGYEYYDNGNVKAEVVTNNGIKTVKEYLENGSIRSELSYRDTILVAGRVYRSDGSYVGRLMQQNKLKGLNIFVSDNVDSLTAFNIASAYYKLDVEKDLKEDPASFYDIYIDKTESYRLGIQVKEGLENDNNILTYNKNILANISRTVLKNKKLEMAFCDEQFNVLRVILQ